MSKATLYGLSYSPWTERARWALDHHRIDYRYREHTPLLGEPLLRLRAKPSAGTPATVPLLVDAHGIHRDSIDIIVHTDRIGTGTKLVPDEGALRSFAAVAEPGLHAARSRVTMRIVADPEALRESARAVVPAFLAPLLAPVAAQGARFIAKKHRADAGDDASTNETIRGVLGELRKRVDLSSVPTSATLRAEQMILATFLQVVSPADVPHLALLPALRRVWTATPLLAESADLVRWRDAVYASARGTTTR